MTPEQWRKEHLTACEKQTGTIKIGRAVLVPGFEERYWSTISLDGTDTPTTVSIRCNGCGETWRGTTLDPS